MDGGLDLSGSQDNDEADNALSMLESCIDWELDSDSRLDPFVNNYGEGNQVASVPSINSESHELQGLNVDDFLEAILLEDLLLRTPPPASTPAAKSAVERLIHFPPICRFELPSEKNPKTC